MKLIKTLSGIVPFVLLVGCSNPAKDLPSASVENTSSPPASAAAPAAAEGRYFAYSPTSSAIAFFGSKVTGSHNGGFKNFAGEFKVVNGKLAGAGNKVVIDTSSLFADNPRLTGHLKSPDFFDVKQFPTSTFVTSAIEDKGTNYNVTGDFTLHGVTKSISFPATIQVADDAVNVTARFGINRSDFGIKYAGMANDLIREKVGLTLNVKAAPGRADFAAVEQAAQTGAAAVQAMPQGGGGGPRPGGMGPRPPGGGPPPGGRPPGPN